MPHRHLILPVFVMIAHCDGGRGGDSDADVDVDIGAEAGAPCPSGGAEVPNREDDDCDGLVDEGFAYVAFWNVRDLSIASRDDTELSLIADVLEAYDLVALAEVNDGDVLPSIEALLDTRRPGWDSYTSVSIGNTPFTAERYGLIWREDRFRLDGVTALPEVETDAGEPFDREPVLARLSAQHGAIDLAMLIVHVTWGDGEGDPIDEVRALREYVRLAREADPDVLVAGDLNRSVGDEHGLLWLLEQTGLVDTTDPDEPTKVDSDETYDHILLDPGATREFTGVRGTDAFDRFLFPDDPEGAERAVSDHRPVWIALDVSRADDD